MPRRWKLILASLCALHFAVGRAPAQQSVLKIVPLNDLPSLDPLADPNQAVRMHALAVYDTLFAWDSKLEPRPMMVDTWTVSDDRLTYTFTLRQGLHFHDGQPVTSQDVVASLRRWMAHDTFGSKLAHALSGMDTAGERTIVLRLKQPFAYVEMALGSAAGMIPVIMRAKDANTDPATPLKDAVGSGPFRFVASEWVPGSKIVYERNSDYSPRPEPTDGLAGGKVVKIDRMEWDILTDPATAAAALSKGEVDYLDAVPPDIVPFLSRTKDVTVGLISPLGSFAGLRPNALFPPFNNPKARQALALMIDQSQFMRAAIGDERWWRTCFAYYLCGAPFGTEVGSEPYRTPDLKRARALMLESGYKGEKLVLISTTDIPIVNALTQVAASELKSIGVETEISYSDVPALMTRERDRRPPGPGSGGWNLIAVFFAGSTNFQPLTNIATDLTCETRTWAAGPCDETTERLKDLLAGAVGGKAQRLALEALHRRLWQVIPLILLGQFRQPSAWRSNLVGLVKPSPVPIFWNVEKP
jgi:peptide/nickel transport system substrate-binding protein